MKFHYVTSRSPSGTIPTDPYTQNTVKCPLSPRSMTSQARVLTLTFGGDQLSDHQWCAFNDPRPPRAAELVSNSPCPSPTESCLGIMGHDAFLWALEEKCWVGKSPFIFHQGEPRRNRVPFSATHRVPNMASDIK